MKHTQDLHPHRPAHTLVTCLFTASAVSRLLCGKISDLPSVDRVMIQQIAFCLYGVCTVCLPFTHSFEALIALTLVMGLCDGPVQCLVGPIAFHLVGTKDASQAIGFMFGVTSGPTIISTAVSGL